jgi:transcriptional regulator with XRE-family HTH domain
MNDKKIGDELKKFFKEKGMTQQYIADKLCVSQATIGALLNGKPFGKKTARTWSNTFGIQLSWLLTGEGEMLRNKERMAIAGDGSVANTGDNTHIDNRRYYSDAPDVLKSQIDDKDKLLREKDERLREKDERLREKDERLREKDAYILELKELIQELKKK